MGPDHHDMARTKHDPADSHRACLDNWASFALATLVSAACFAILRAISFMPVNLMSNILVFDASSAWCSVALHVNGVLYSVAEMQPRKHAQLIMPMIEDVCNRASIKPVEIE